MKKTYNKPEIQIRQLSIRVMMLIGSSGTPQSIRYNMNQNVDYNYEPL